jgi:hypothetical protein
VRAVKGMSDCQRRLNFDPPRLKNAEVNLTHQTSLGQRRTSTPMKTVVSSRVPAGYHHAVDLRRRA